MKVSMPQFPSAPAEKPAETLPRQDSPDLEEDAALFRQSMDENKAEAKNQPGARDAGPGHGAEARHWHGAPDAHRHEHHTVGARHHEHGAAGAHHEPGATGTHHEPGAAGAQRHETGITGATQEQSEVKKTADETHKADATAPDDDAAAAADDKDTTAIPETGQDLHQLMATQEARSHEIAAQKAGEVSQPAISQELVDKVANRILVSVGHDGQDREVRIEIKDTVLQDTEVSIKYEQGELVVNFMTQSAADNSLLNNSSQAIKASLEQALDGEVRVNVSAEADDAGDTRDDQRSRGMYIDEEEDHR